jgi:hypothetical protein
MLYGSDITITIDQIVAACCLPAHNIIMHQSLRSMLQLHASSAHEAVQKEQEELGPRQIEPAAWKPLPPRQIR